MTGVAESPERVHKAVSWLFPSIKDILFLAFLFVPLMTKESGVLYDGDTGWHIRNGEHILATGTFPRADYFSYTREGAPWFAWEWLADVIMALIHQYAGLLGIVVWANIVFALTFTLLFHWMLNQGNNILVSLGFTALAGFASSVHWLARPHLFTMLFVLIWSILLQNIEQQGICARSKHHFWLFPLLIALWANTHGGFVVGIILLLIHAIANLLSGLTSSDAVVQERSRSVARHLLKLTVVCLLTTLLNPYGIHLHRHILDSYLFSQYLVDRITEFASPDFHTLVVKFFELILLSTIVIPGVAMRRLSFLDVGLIVFWTHMALFSVRHVPLYSVMIVPLMVRRFSEYIQEAPMKMEAQAWIGRWIRRFADYSDRMNSFESQFKGLVYPTLALVLLVFLCRRDPASGGRDDMQVGFDPKRFPLKAAEYIEQRKLAGNLFTTDYWGGYLIYRFYPRHKVFFDGRSDMYGRNFLKEYEAIINLDYSWKAVLDKYQVSWILVPVDAGLATALKELKNWKIIYDDHQAIIFEKQVLSQALAGS